MAARRRNSPIVAIVDIGSNSVRLVIYFLEKNRHMILYEKKAICGLARGMLHDRPALSTQGMARTLKTLRKFRAALKKREIENVLAIGTAAMRAVRHTKKGHLFHRKAEQALGHKIAIISGRKEAQLTAYGVMSVLPKAAGVCGDLGGGSLELAHINKGKSDHVVTLPFGSLTLLDEARGNMTMVRQIMRARLAPVRWLDRAARGRTFYPIGGSWRAMARVMMKKRGLKIKAVHGFTIGAALARKYALAIAGQKPAAFRKMHKKIRQRAEVLPLAAAVLVELIDRMQPKNITFSAHGVREGLLRRGL